MDLPIDAEVDCTDGPCGRSTHIILNPETEQVTHLVVREHSYAQRLVPVSLAFQSSPDRIQIRCSKDELSRMAPFIRSEFIPMGMTSPAYMLWPASTLEMAVVTLEHEQIPPGEVAIDRGSRVEALDGHIGHVDELLIDRLTRLVTHLVLREGHLWGQRDITIPVVQIDHIQDDTVYLKLKKDDIEKLPQKPIHKQTR
jgi:sporulation protein YlmC with PRC-barrel domain